MLGFTRVTDPNLGVLMGSGVRYEVGFGSGFQGMVGPEFDFQNMVGPGPGSSFQNLVRSGFGLNIKTWKFRDIRFMIA